MKIAILVEGATEVAFKEKLNQFLKSRLGQKMPRLIFIVQNGRIPKEEKLKRLVENLLTGKNAYDAVIALTDIYTGTKDFQNAADAKAKMAKWVGNNPKFYPHTASHDFEAWLLPYWNTIQKRAKHNRSAPSGEPEDINHNKPPSYWIKEIFSSGKCGRDYNKRIDGKEILKNQDLMVAIRACPELKAFVNTIIALCGGEEIP
jgi:hypothetical protein